MKEKDIEQRLIDGAESLGGTAIKFTGARGVPDRIVLRPVPPEHREIVARYIAFVEVKRPGQRARKLQQFWLGVFARYGFKTAVVSTPSEVDTLLRSTEGGQA